ncbi:MAG TPA: DUF2064 domain-containing protein [Thermoanaerobaculia bacterium]|nr:DUF2064 domain-containing protein [Thermoanaerobaculia bacterium]
MRSGAATLLVFTLGPQTEVRRRGLLPATFAGVEHQLYQHCLDAALEAGTEAGCRVVLTAPAPLELGPTVATLVQPEGSFGERLAAAVGQLDDGPLVVVGTDVPGLTGDHVRRALELLAEDPAQAVVGPSPDGGFYLLAVARPVAHLLGAVRWCGRHTREDLEHALAAAGFRVRRLASLADLDHRRDLERFAAGAHQLASEGWRALLASVRRALAVLAAPLARPAAEVSLAPALAGPAGRAPPRRLLPR